MENTRALHVAAPHGAEFSRCEDEPIATPGAIQPHGALVVVDCGTEHVSHVSENVGAVLGVEPAKLLGITADELGDMLQVVSPDARDRTGRNGRVLLSHSVAPNGRRLTSQRIAHGSHIFFEFEPKAQDEPDNGIILARAIREMRRAESHAALYAIAVEAIHQLTGYDRVVMYVFDTAWHGEVVAEIVREGCTSTLGLRFPSTDIPAQARALYARTAYRTVVDVDYTPVPIVCRDAALPPLDLGHCALRSMSPIHREYLRNFKARASISLSVMQKEHLFGLLSCNHEAGPKSLTPQRREACVAIAEMLSGMLEREYPAHEEASPRSTITRLAREMLHAADVATVLTGNAPNMLSAVAATGGALLYHDQLTTCGDVPHEKAVGELVAWLQAGKLDDGAYVTDSLPRAFAAAEGYRDCGCGLLAVACCEDPFTLMLWFRGEIAKQVAWGGKDAQGHQTDGSPLTPRSSFARWQEAVHLHAEPFSEHDVAGARQLGREVEQTIVRQSLRLVRANAALERSNRELDAFAHAASHDLKEPLRGMHDFVALAQRELAEGHDAGAIAARLTTVTKLTERMNGLIGALMHYARVGGSHLELHPTPLRPLIEALLGTLRSQPNDRPVAFDVAEALPAVLADQALLSEVFTNLFTNAIKYNKQHEVRIAVGTAPSENADMVTLFVRDNGIGVAAEHCDDIFEIFRRLHAGDKFGGGSGTGLTIAKRIVEAHGGTMWLTSLPGKGSTFYFSMHRAHGAM